MGIGVSRGRKARQSRRARKTQGAGSHADLGQRFAEIGEDLASRSSRQVKMTLKPGQGYRGKKLSEILKDVGNSEFQRTFGRRYRDVHQAQDELISTSSVREMIKGAIKPGSLSPAKEAELEKVFELMSQLRFPTKWTGFSLKHDVMQHPTADGGGLFGVSSKTMARHNELDLQRRNEVAAAMQDAASNRNASAETIANAGMRAAIEFSLNEFIAPASAKDVRPFSLAPNRGRDKEIVQQVAAREELKVILVRLGGTQDRGKTALRRKWRSRRGKRSASPPRLDPNRQMKPDTVTVSN